MKRSGCLRRIVLAVLAMSGLLSVTRAADPGRTNVLLICVDDLKPVLGCYGDRQVKSPNIDRLAARGLLFQRAYCNQAVCAPSRNSLMTGVRPTSLGIYDLGTHFRYGASNAVTLSQYFMRHGYRAEALGKVFHVGHGNYNDAASWSVPIFGGKTVAYARPESRGQMTREEALFDNELDVARLPRGAAYESADVPDDAYPDGRLAEEAMRRLRAARTNSTPFFLALGFLKPHLPFCAPKKYWDLYQRQDFKVPALRRPPVGAPAYAPSSWGELRQYTGMPDKGAVPEDEARALIHGYYAAVSYMDAQLGKVLDEMDRLGLTTNTVVVLWGDHGWHLGDHGWWCKHDNYEQATRIPLLISAPGVTKPGTRTDALAETVDLYPTLCALAGLPAPQNPQPLEGKSLVPILERPGRTIREAVFHVYPRDRRGEGQILGRAVRTERYRLVEWKKPGAPANTAEFELYDYQADPEESANLATVKPKVVERLRGILATLPEARPQISAPRAVSPRQRTNRQELFERKDTNRDGHLTFEEFMAGQPDPDQAPKRFERFDTNKDRTLSRDEFIFMGQSRETEK